MLAFIGAILALGGEISGGAAAMYVGKANFRDALLRGYAETTAIGFLVRMFRSRAHRLDTWIWIELTRQPLIRRTRRREGPRPAPIRRTMRFGVIEALIRWVDSDHLAKRGL